MSKELEALKYLKENKRKHWLDDDKSNECLDIIETELKRLEYIEDKLKQLDEQFISKRIYLTPAAQYEFMHKLKEGLKELKEPIKQ